MTDWTPNRRWDPVVWQAAGRWHMVCLAADYQAEGNKVAWFNEDNALERWSGPDLEHLELEAVKRRQGRVWTAASVFRYHNDVIGLAGWNDHRPTMNQDIHFVDLYSLEIERGYPLPKRPPHKAYKGAISWRDASIVQWDNRFLLTVTTGGFRWGCVPNVYGFVSDHPRGPWVEIGPVLDPAIAVFFAELERPQLIRLQDGRWAMLASCWSERQFIGSGVPPIHLFVSPWDDPVFTRHIATINAPYGLNVHDGHWCGWRWINRETYTSEVVVMQNDQSIDHVVAQAESALEKSPC